MRPASAARAGQTIDLGTAADKLGRQAVDVRDELAPLRRAGQLRTDIVELVGGQHEGIAPLVEADDDKGVGGDVVVAAEGLGEGVRRRWGLAIRVSGAVVWQAGKMRGIG